MGTRFAAKSVSWSGRLPPLLMDPGLREGKGKSLMATNKHEFRTAIFEDGTCSVLRAAPNKPHLLEVIATFHDAARARDYIRLESNSSDEHPVKRPVGKQAAAAQQKRASKPQPKQAAAAKPARASE